MLFRSGVGREGGREGGGEWEEERNRLGERNGWKLMIKRD